MAEEIKRIINIQTGNSENSINSLNREIKELSDELNGLTIGTERYAKVSEQLAVKQRTLRETTYQLEVMSKTTQQRFENLQKFANGLTSGFSALTGVFTLVGSESEDFNKTITKLTSTLTILNSLGGLKDLIESFPGVVNGFKNIGKSISNVFNSSFKSFDPLERRLNKTVENLKNIDIKLPEIKLPETSQPIVAANKAYQEQQRTIVPLNKELQKNLELLQNQKKALQESLDAKQIDADKIAKQINLNKELIEVTKQYNNVLEAAIKGSQDIIEDEALDTFAVKQGSATEKALTELAEKRNKLIESGAISFTADSEGIQRANDRLAKTQELMDQIRQEISENEKAIEQANRKIEAQTGLWQSVKSVLSTVGWTLLITTLVTAAYKLFDYIKQVNSAAKAQKKLNQEINNTTAQLASSNLSKFFELQDKYLSSTEDKSKFLSQYAKELESTGLQLSNIEQLEDAFVNNTDRYKQAIIDRAKADAYREQISKQTQEYLEKQLELERQIESGEYKKLSAGQQYAVGAISTPTGTAEQAREQEALRQQTIQQFQEENLKKLKEEQSKLDDDYDKTLNQLLSHLDELSLRNQDLWAETTKSVGKTVEKAIEVPDIDPILDEVSADLNKFYDTLDDISYTDKDKELNALNEWFNQSKELFNEYEGDLTLLAEEYARRRQAILDKYQPKVESNFDAELAKINEQYQLGIDTLNKLEPKTEYKRFGLQFQYQSGRDVEREYQSEVAYNNQVYELTKERIAETIQLLMAELENESLTGEEKLNIRKKIDDEYQKLADADKKRDDDNTEAAISKQKKRLAAFQAAAQVTSSILGSLGSVYDLKAENAKSEKEMKKAANTAKGFKVAQAVIDALSAANGAYASLASAPYGGPFLGAAAAAAALAAGYANVKQILAQDVTGKSVQTAQATPTPVSTPAVSYTKELLGDKELDIVNQPIKCYVLEQDITNAQQKVKVNTDNSIF